MFGYFESLVGVERDLYSVTSTLLLSGRFLHWGFDNCIACIGDAHG